MERDHGVSATKDGWLSATPQQVPGDVGTSEITRKDTKVGMERWKEQEPSLPTTPCSKLQHAKKTFPEKPVADSGTAIQAEAA